MEAWAVDDPVDAWECERGRRIRERQGNDNPLLSACAAAQEADRVPVPEP
jgi:endonuclease I